MHKQRSACITFHIVYCLLLQSLMSTNENMVGSSSWGVWCGTGRQYGNFSFYSITENFCPKLRLKCEAVFLILKNPEPPACCCLHWGAWIKPLLHMEPFYAAGQPLKKMVLNQVGSLYYLHLCNMQGNWAVLFLRLTRRKTRGSVLTRLEVHRLTRVRLSAVLE